MDLDAAVGAFLADGAQSALVLPNLSPEQRRQAKRLVDGHPGLRCESYGFGAERQLHVFKDGAPPAPSDAAAAPMLPVRAMSRELGPDDGAAAEDGAETVRSSVLRRFGAQKPPGLSTPAGPLEVRHTFIHFEDPEKETRQVQSMPPGVFQTALRAEAASLRQEAVPPLPSAAGTCGPVLLGATAATQPPPKVSVIEEQFSPGTPIQIIGLSKCPAFNGRQGRVGNFDEETGRYNIILPVPTGQEQWAKVKHENLALVHPEPPPQFAHVPAVPVRHQVLEAR
jgi:hypothetical protein